MKPLPSVKITVEIMGGKTHRLSIIEQPWRGRVWVRYNGKASDKLPDSTVSLLMVEIRKMIVRGLKNEPNPPN